MLVLALLLLLALRVGSVWDRVAVVLALLAIDALAHGVWAWHVRRLPVANGPEALVGRSVTAVSDCRPYGRVRLGAEQWQARCARGAEAGERLVVDAVEALTLVVHRPDDRAV